MSTGAHQQSERERDRLPAPVETERERRSRSVRFGLPAAGLVLVLFLANAFVVQPFRVPSTSMTPTLKVGDRILVNKLAYRFGNSPRRGDVVVFDGTGSFAGEEPEGSPVTRALWGAGAVIGVVGPSGTDYVKRVIGVGGDRVRCCDKRGRIEVNGVPRHEGYLHPGDVPSTVPFDVRVPHGRLWVMGDHRSGSSDSRDHLGEPGGGTVPVGQVIGRADWIGWPAQRWGASIAAGAGAHG